MKTTEDFYNFQNIYGEFFSTRVQQGGRLFSTEDVTNSSAETTEEKVKSMKAAAAASFSGYGASVDMSASYGKGSNAKGMKVSSESVSTLTWQANGGDTLLCNQTRPQEWAPTVAYHWNWRITRQDHIASIFDVAAQIKGMDWVIKEAIPLGLTINPNFDDAVPKPPAVLAEPKKTFTIQAEGYGKGRYLLTYPSSVCTTAAAAQACNMTKTSNFKIDSTVQKWGCILLGPETAESHDVDRLYEAENLNGEVQNEVSYTHVPSTMIASTKIKISFDTTPSIA
ncbi:hypothetical protein NW768_009988 [Fusarium equiseti]|uniref:MACPF domain-containing protein n=1 Tax=Fusarium equiseti TaxID=61235 RepID=A0ABQ8R1P0_FUSEQ|nr:hypothetical protein NW768_009988 [Fusarium equiseti]